MTGGDLEKATEIPWNKKTDVTCSIEQSASKSSHDEASMDPRVRK
jgi:hypothetical protein